MPEARMSREVPMRWGGVVLGWLLSCVPVLALCSPAQRITTADGLPANEVNQVVEDRHGYLWFATADGLARHDGSGFRVWRMEHGLADNDVRSLALDGQDQLWIGTGNGYLQRLSADRQHLARWAGPRAQAAAASPVLAVQPLADGSVWFGTRDAGAYRLGGDGRLRQFLPTADGRGLPSARVDQLVADAAGGVWLGTAAGLARWQDDRFQPPDMLGANALPVTALGLDAQGALWSSTSVGTDVRQLPSLQPDAGRAHAGHRWLGHSRNGGQWFSDGMRVWWQDRSGQHTHAITLPGSDRRTRPGIARVVEDRQGRAWLLGSHQGLWRLGAQWRHVQRFTAPSSQGGAAAAGLAAAADGTAWQAWGGWLTRVSPTSGFDRRRWPYAHDPARTDRHAVADDGRGQVWVFAAPWLTRIDAARGPQQHWRVADEHGAFQDPPSSGHAVLRICGDHLWLAGLGRLEQRTRAGAVLGTWSYDAVQLRPGGAPFVLHCDATEQMWLGDRDGLKQWQPAVGRFVPVPGAPRRQAGALHLAADGRLWVADAEGWVAYRHDAGRLQRSHQFDAAQGLPAVLPRGLADAGDGTLWATTARGVVSLQPDQRSIRLYTAEDGMPMMVLASDLIVAGQHLMAMGVEGDLLVLDPAGMAAATVPPMLVIDRVQVRRHGRWIELPAADPLRLNADDRDIQLSARLLTGGQGGGSDYRFRLRGEDPDWVRAGQRGTRGFPRLPPGEHVLEYQARGVDGRWSPLQSTRLQVAYSGWAHPGAWALLLLATLGAVTLIAWQVRRHCARHLARQRVARRQARAEQAAQAKARYLATLGHEIRTPLTGVLGMSELLLTAPLPPPARAQVLHIQQGGRDLLEVVDAALQTARLQAGKLPLQPRCFDIAVWLDDLHLTLERVMAPHDCALTLSRQLPAGAHGEGDPERMQQVVESLLLVLAAHVSAARIVLRAASLPGRAGLLIDVIVTVGAGPAPALSTLRDALADTGILMHALHGRLHVSARNDHTWQVGLSLPMPWATRDPIVAHASPAGALQVLLVEDDPLVAEVICGLLQVQGHAVNHAAHALAALSRLAEAGTQLILLDLDLPGIDGLSLLRLIRQQGHCQPVLVVTARRDPDLVAQVTLAGAEGLLHKPLAGDALQAALRRVRPC